jgi:hypothetical protein
MAALLPSRHSFTMGMAAKPAGQAPLLLLLPSRDVLLLLLLLCNDGMVMVADSLMVPLLVSTTCSAQQHVSIAQTEELRPVTLWWAYANCWQPACGSVLPDTLHTPQIVAAMQ